MYGRKPYTPFDLETAILDHNKMGIVMTHQSNWPYAKIVRNDRQLTVWAQSTARPDQFLAFNLKQAAAIPSLAKTVFTIGPESMLDVRSGLNHRINPKIMQVENVRVDTLPSVTTLASQSTHQAFKLVFDAYDGEEDSTKRESGYYRAFQKSYGETAAEEDEEQIPTVITEVEFEFPINDTTLRAVGSFIVEHHLFETPYTDKDFASINRRLHYIYN